MTATDRLLDFAAIAWAGRPRWWDFVWAGTGVVIFLVVLHATLAFTLIAAVIVLLGGPWVDIAFAWHRYGRRSTCSCGDQGPA